MTEQQREAGRQELFSLMRQEHGVTCMESELTDIEQCVLSYALSHAEGEAVVDLECYDAGLLGSGGGGHVAWWHDYIRAVLEDAHDFYLQQVGEFAHPAPQVAVPEQRGEAVATVRDERATVDRLSVDDLRRICMLPAGTKLYTHSAPAGEQPVSDPDGLTEPGRREAEQAYINCAFDYARDPIGSRDWILFWNGWRARNKAAPAPDEREIAARALEGMADTIHEISDHADDPMACKAYGRARAECRSEAARLRAGKGDE